MVDAIPSTHLGPQARIGLLADTHCHGAANDLPGSVLTAFRGIDLVLHLGDMGDAAVLDRLAAIAPAVATRGRDDPQNDDRIAPTVRVIEAGGLVVGAVFDLTDAGLAILDGDRLTVAGHTSNERLEAVFGRRVDVVAFGATHRGMVASSGGVLLVNPGSATLPAGGDERTVAILEVCEGVATVQVVRV
jgi:putative phosphoesterase